MNEEIQAIIGRGCIGIMGVIGGVMGSLAQVKEWMQVISLGAGIIVAGVTIWSLIKRTK